MEKKKTLKEQAYQAIRSEILAGSLPPGTPLGEVQISQRLGISRTPIRAALQQLVYEKLAVQDATGHIYVAAVSDKDVHDITVMRCALEPLAIEEAKFPVSKERIVTLCEIEARQEDAVQKNPPDLLAYAELDRDFHTAFAKCCDNDILIDTIRNVNTIMVRYNVLSGTLASHVDAALQEHKQIIDFLKQGQKDFAVVAVRSHIQKVSDRILKK